MADAAHGDPEHALADIAAIDARDSVYQAGETLAGEILRGQGQWERAMVRFRNGRALEAYADSYGRAFPDRCDGTTKLVPVAVARCALAADKPRAVARALREAPLDPPAFETVLLRANASMSLRLAPDLIDRSALEALVDTDPRVTQAQQRLSAIESDLKTLAYGGLSVELARAPLEPPPAFADRALVASLGPAGQWLADRLAQDRRTAASAVERARQAVRTEWSSRADEVDAEVAALWAAARASD